MTAQGMVVLLDGDALVSSGAPALPRFEAAAGPLRRPQSELRQVLAFSPGAGPLRVCVPVAAVADITRGLAPAPLGGAPFVTGVLSWQGNAVPLVALDRLLRLGPAQQKVPLRTLICRAEQTGLVGIPASRVWEIVALSAGAELRPLPQALRWARPLLRGVYLTARGPLSALDLDSVAAAAGLAPTPPS
jgi:chemotaxis signal transduction protein